MIRAIPLGLFFDYLGGAARRPARGRQGDGGELELHRREDPGAPDAGEQRAQPPARSPGGQPDATITLKRATLDQISLRQKTFADALKAGEIVVTGNGDKLGELLGLVDTFAPMFDVVTPPLKR